jgi:hypothetical protein
VWHELQGKGKMEMQSQQIGHFNASARLIQKTFKISLESFFPKQPGRSIRQVTMQQTSVAVFHIWEKEIPRSTV